MINNKYKLNFMKKKKLKYQRCIMQRELCVNESCLVIRETIMLDFLKPDNTAVPMFHMFIFFM